MELERDVTAEALDSSTVLLTLSTPLGGFLQAATQPIAPAHLLGQVPPEMLPEDPFGQVNGTVPVGSGPFRMVFLDESRALLAAATPVSPPYTGGGSPNFMTPRPSDSFATPPPTPRRGLRPASDSRAGQ